MMTLSNPDIFERAHMKLFHPGLYELYNPRFGKSGISAKRMPDTDCPDVPAESPFASPIGDQFTYVSGKPVTFPTLTTLDRGNTTGAHLSWLA